MTIDLNSLLDSISPDTSESTLDQVAALAADDGIDIFGVYCLHTGKRIGSFERDEVLFALRDESSENIEDLVDAMIIRVVASMRPSPALNKPDHLTLRSLAISRPVDIMAYLVNRLNGTRDLLIKRSDESLSPLVNRITTYNRIAGLAASGISLTPWIHWLLELDCKMNLHDLQAPIVKLAPFHRLMFDMLCIDNHEQLLKEFESWAIDHIRRFDKRDAQITRESNWIRGNTFARAAYVNSWMENPELPRKVEIANKKLQAKFDSKSKPGRPKSEATRKREDRVAKALDALSAILDSKDPTPSSQPAKSAPTLRLNFAALAKHIKKD